MKKILYILLFFSCSIFGQHQTMLLVSQQQYANESSGAFPYVEDFASYSSGHGTPNTEVFDFSGITWTNIGTHNFQTITGGTPSSSTGANGGTDNGTQDAANPYCYFEASSGGGNAGNTVILESSVIDASSTDPYIRLYYHFFNDAIGDPTVFFRVQAWDGTTWNELINFQSQTGVLQGDDYVQLIGDATTYTNSDFKFRLFFDLTVTASGNSAFRDACIDKIEIYNGTP